MNRLSEQTSTDLAANHARYMATHVWGDDLQSAGAVNICENCQQPCEHLNDVSGFGFRGCDRCYDEAMEIIEKEAAELLHPTPAVCCEGKVA